MPISRDEVISVCQQLAEQENLQVCVTESAKGALVAGGCAFAGGLLAGPLGLAAGGIVGSLAAAFKGRGKYKSVVEVIMYDMTPSQQEKLVASIHRALENIGPEDFVFIGALVMQNSSMQKMIIMELTKFLKNEMGLAIAS